MRADEIKALEIRGVSCGIRVVAFTSDPGVFRDSCNLSGSRYIGSSGTVRASGRVSAVIESDFDKDSQNDDA